MSDTGAPRRGRHSSADDSTGGIAAPWTGHREPADSRGSRRYDLPAPPATREWSLPAGGSPQSGQHRSGLLDADRTGPLMGGPLGAGDRLAPATWARHAADDDERPAGDDDPRLDGPVEWPADGYVPEPGRHPSAPLPPRPPGVWDRFARRSGDQPVLSPDEAPTEARPFSPDGPPVPVPHPADSLDDHPDAHLGEHPVEAGAHDDATDAHALDWQDHTGGLEVIGTDADVRRGRRRRREEGGGRRRRPLAVLVLLLLLAGVVAGVLVGGRTLLDLVNPVSEDFSGAGTGTAEVRVEEGDTLSDIGRSLVDAGVIASVEPFVDAAEANTASTGIQPGIYALRQRMSGQAALDLMLDPVARQVSRITVPEGLTAAVTFQRLSESTGIPVAEFEAAAADPAALGLPDWAGGTIEGLLFPATYDFEPDATPTQMLAAMVDRAQQAFDALQIPVDQRLTVVTKASLVQAEASTAEDMAKVARVLENRLSEGMALQLDTTVNYANGKGGITTTPEDRANPSLYNTYVHTGLPPGPISNPGEQALSAVQNPAEGPWRFFVVVDPDTGETRFAETAEEHQQNVLLFQQWLRENPEE
jgi:UPF0755 protein